MKSVGKKMIDLMGVWGPYSKKYSGISRITEHSFEKGVRFDCVVSPAIENADSRVPNVTVPVGVHPWEAKSDYSFYSYRYDLEWKDRVYADVSFTRLSKDSVLIRTEFFNNTEIKQICLLNLFSAIEYPNVTVTKPVLPEKCVYIDALDYASFEFATARPWDRQTIDAMKKGEFFDDNFCGHRGLGDRDDNRYILQKFPKFAADKGDTVSYITDINEDFSEPALFVRYRTTDGKNAEFTFNGKTVVFPESDSMNIVKFPVDITNGKNEFTFFSNGSGGIELDFLAVCEKNEEIQINAEKHPFVPQIKISETENGKKVSYKYDGIDGKFNIRTFNSSTRFRDFPTGCLEDSPTARVSQPDESFQNMLETFSGSFSEKHSDDGFYHNTVVHTIYIDPGKTHTEYAVLSFGETEYLTTEEYEKIYENAVTSLEKQELNKSGKKYEFSNQILRSTVLQNTVYPLCRHGEYVIHHTPGKRWDSFYTWDSGFIGLGMLEYAPEIADYILDTYLSDDDNPDYAFLLHGSPVPTHIYQYFEMLCRNNDKENLLKYYPRVKMFYDFLAGKINGSLTDKFNTGLTTTFDYFYNCSGMDDLPPQKQMYKESLQKYAAPAISTSQVIRCAKLLYIVADLLGLEEDKNVYSEDIEKRTNALQKYSWDEESGYFSYVIHDSNGNCKCRYKTENGENLDKTMDGIYPIIAGAVTESQKERILSHLKSETEMFTPVGISAVDRTASYYVTNGYWNGNVWMSHQWFVWKTMLDLGETDFAYKIAKTAIDVWKQEVEYSYYTFEMVNIETHRGGWFHNFGGLSTPISIWANAYYKPGTLSAGFDTFVNYRNFNGDCTRLECRITHYGDSERFSVLAVMNGKKTDYTVLANGKQAEFKLRDESAIEIILDGNAKEYEIVIE